MGDQQDRLTLVSLLDPGQKLFTAPGKNSHTFTTPGLKAQKRVTALTWTELAGGQHLLDFLAFPLSKAAFPGKRLRLNFNFKKSRNGLGRLHGTFDIGTHNGVKTPLILKTAGGGTGLAKAGGIQASPFPALDLFGDIPVRLPVPEDEDTGGRIFSPVGVGLEGLALDVG